VKFVETPVFTKVVREHLSDDEYRGLQLALLLRPEQGSIIPGSGGLRKVRWKVRGRVRVIYYWITAEDAIYMLYLYEKTAQSDLTRAQVKVLRGQVREELE
jgi:hypothetical protein